jgi:hypothetical protein
LPGLWAIYDAAQGVTGTTSVTAWADQSGNGKNLTLANPSNPLELVAAEVNSLPAIHSKFTGGYGTFISATNALPALTAGGVIWAVVKQTTADISIGSGVTNFMQAGSEFEIKRHNIAIPGAICASALGSGLAGVAAADNVYHIVRLVIGVSNLKLAINNGTEDVESVFNTPAASTLNMFGQGDKYIAYVAIATALPSANDITNMEAYLNSKFDVY